MANKYDSYFGKFEFTEKMKDEMIRQMNIDLEDRLKSTVFSSHPKCPKPFEFRNQMDNYQKASEKSNSIELTKCLSCRVFHEPNQKCPK